MAKSKQGLASRDLTSLFVGHRKRRRSSYRCIGAERGLLKDPEIGQVDMHPEWVSFVHEAKADIAELDHLTKLPVVLVTVHLFELGISATTLSGELIGQWPSLSNVTLGEVRLEIERIHGGECVGLISSDGALLDKRFDGEALNPDTDWATLQDRNPEMRIAHISQLICQCMDYIRQIVNRPGTQYYARRDEDARRWAQTGLANQLLPLCKRLHQKHGLGHVGCSANNTDTGLTIDLVSVLKELASFEIEESSILDRIDYNAEWIIMGQSATRNPAQECVSLCRRVLARIIRLFLLVDLLLILVLVGRWNLK